MKTYRFLKTMGCMIILSMSLFSCEEDDESNLTGKLSLSISNQTDDVNIEQLNVYPIENLNIVLTTIKLDHNGRAQKEMNIGNYYITVSANKVFTSTGFQIKPNTTTSLIWRGDDRVIVDD